MAHTIKLKEVRRVIEDYKGSPTSIKAFLIGTHSKLLTISSIAQWLKMATPSDIVENINRLEALQDVLGVITPNESSKLIEELHEVVAIAQRLSGETLLIPYDDDEEKLRKQLFYINNILKDVTS